MTIFELIEDNIFLLLDDVFTNDPECAEANREIQRIEDENDEFRGQLLNDDSLLSKYVDLLNQRCTRMTELAYR